MPAAPRSTARARTPKGHRPAARPPSSATRARALDSRPARGYLPPMLRRAAVLLLLAVSGCIYFPNLDGESATDSDGDTGTGGQEGEDLFIAVGDGGTILRSADGAGWTTSTSGVTVALNAVAHGTGKFVAVGQAGKILYSTNGVDWSAASSPSSRDLHAVVWHSTRFYAVGGDYSVGAETLESLDGITWTRPELPAPKHLLYDLATDGATLVAIGSYQSDLMTFGAFTWQDGVGWVQRLDGAASGIRYSAVGHGAPNFVLIGPTNTSSSGDGISWQNTPLFNLPADPQGLSFGPGGWVAVGGAGQILGSTGAVQWTARLSPFMLDLHDVASNGFQYVTVGAAGQIATSPDGSTWTARISPVTVELRGITHTRE